MRLYLDTNIVIALFVAEERSSAVRALLRSHRLPLVSSELVRLEVIATLARKAREGVLSEAGARKAAVLADQWLLGETDCVPVNTGDFEAARTMLKANFSDNLRTPDAIHMALALRGDAILVSHDRRLLELAPAFGLKTLTT